MIVKPVAIGLGVKDPDAAYAAVRGKDTYLLESAEGGEKVARYSFIGFNPVAKLVIKDGKVDFKAEGGLKSLAPKAKDPLSAIREIMSKFKLDDPGSARFFGGFVGYFGYDLVRYYIDLDSKQKTAKDDLKQPDCEFVLAKNNIIFDHKAGRTLLTQNEFGESPRDIDEGAAREDLDGMISSFAMPAFRVNEPRKVDISSNTTEAEFKGMVNRTLEYIRSGDIIQAVLSQRFETDFDTRSGGFDTFAVFRALKKINPSPYMYHLDFGSGKGARQIVGSSPEMLARVEGKRVLTYPIAGTRRRGKDETEDRRLETELLGDAKERAEHLMLVDLGRNDIGRVAKFGTVKVNKFMSVEKYSHVQHLVSEVEGELTDGKDPFDAFKSIFPAGTVSGAPKVRAMEIIDELEPSRRGIYAGSVGYFSFNGNMDTAITIRTLVFEKGKAYLQAGAGIVADSKPESEYKETVSKAKALFGALENS